MATKPIPQNIDPLTLAAAVHHDRLLIYQARCKVGGRQFYSTPKPICVSHFASFSMPFAKGTPHRQRFAVAERQSTAVKLKHVRVVVERGTSVVVGISDHRKQCVFCVHQEEAAKARARKAITQRQQKKEAARAQADSI